MWDRILGTLSEKFEVKKFDGAGEKDINVLEDKLGVKLPEELRELLKNTDGLEVEKTRIIRPVKDILEDNERFRSDENILRSFMPFDSLLFFGDSGGAGDLLAYAIIQGEISKTGVYVWDHENDSRTWIAPSIQKLLEWWIDGKIKV
ncbi:MAG: SMI1/KNR4 family protein [Patescibacteria group bacterium]|nr:SMI1/KNR4 family protein [Patescibacteria group bacterium]